jgi:hypothetical protein
MYLLGRLLGWLIVTGYTLTICNYFVKLINRKVISGLPTESPIRTRYMAVMRVIVRYHRYFAFVTVAALLTHLVIQSLNWGIYVTGVIAGSLLILQAALGAYGAYAKNKKSGTWLVIHRAVAVLLFVAVLFHVITAKYGLITLRLG